MPRADVTRCDATCSSSSWSSVVVVRVRRHHHDHDHGRRPRTTTTFTEDARPSPPGDDDDHDDDDHDDGGRRRRERARRRPPLRASPRVQEFVSLWVNGMENPHTAEAPRGRAWDSNINPRVRGPCVMPATSTSRGRPTPRRSGDLATSWAWASRGGPKGEEQGVVGLWDRGIVGCGGRGGRGDEDVGTTNIIDTQPPICGRRRRRRSGWMDGWMDGRDGRSRCVRLHTEDSTTMRTTTTTRRRSTVDDGGDSRAMWR